MMKKKSLILSAAAVLALSTALMAAPRGHKDNGGTSIRGERGDRNFVAGLTRALDLTAEQQTSITTLYTAVQTNVQTIREQHRTQSEEIRTLLDSDNPDPTVIGQKVIAAHATREQVEALFDTFVTQVSALLTAEQLAKFETLLDEHDGRGPFGFGFGFGFGPGGPGH